MSLLVLCSPVLRRTGANMGQSVTKSEMSQGIAGRIADLPRGPVKCGAWPRGATGEFLSGFSIRPPFPPRAKKVAWETITSLTKETLDRLGRRLGSLGLWGGIQTAGGPGTRIVPCQLGGPSGGPGFRGDRRALAEQVKDSCASSGRLTMTRINAETRSRREETRRRRTVTGF